MTRCTVSLLLLALVAAPAGSTILIKKDLAELAREAELVIVARVQANACAWNPEGTLIWTTTTLAVSESWKGTAAGTIGTCATFMSKPRPFSSR